MIAFGELTFDEGSDQRRVERVRCNRGALLCIPKLKNLFAFTVRDMSERGIGMRLHPNCRLLPVEFMVAEEGLRNVRRCRLVWRENDFAGAEFID
jgi:hypothetical protein